MNERKRNPPLVLDMSFGEALERFIGVDPKELSEDVVVRKRSGVKLKGQSVATWCKKLSPTDAQAETTGGLVPYLRLTKSSLTNEDFHTWFRDEFFAGAAWKRGEFGREAVEIATVPFSITVRDLVMGTEAMTVTHGVQRREKHSAPTTWLHWSASLQQLLSLNNFTGKSVRLTRDEYGAFRLDIDAAADA